MTDSLSPNQVLQIKKSWSEIAQDPAQLASAMVIRYFTQNPEYQSLFKRLKDLSIGELPSNPQFKRHASKVGGALAAVVNNLDKPEELNELLTDLGIKHKKFGLTPKHFQELGDVLIGIIVEAIGETEKELLDLWKSSLTSVMNILIKSSC